MFIFTPNNFWYLRIMLHNVYVIFSYQVSATTLHATRCAIDGSTSSQAWGLGANNMDPIAHLTCKLGARRRKTTRKTPKRTTYKKK